MNKKKIILTIPVYNGERYIEKTVSELISFKNDNILLKIVFVDDGSRDKTRNKLINMSSKFGFDFYFYDRNKGKGEAIKYAFENIKNEDFDYFIFTDIELPYGLDFLNNISDFEKYDFIVGNRKLEKIKQYNFYRKVMSKIFRLFLPRKVKKFTDTQCGLKIFNKKTAEFIFNKIKTKRWIFDLEIFLIASKNNFKILQLAVIIKEKCIKNKGGVSLLKHGFFILKDLILIHFYNKRKKYE